MLKTLLIVFTLFLFNQNIPAQTGNFFPMAIGNEYQFHNSINNYWFGTIERDTVYPNEHRYFSLPYFFEFGDARVDEDGNVLSASKPFFIDGDPEEYLLFKADAELDEVWAVAWNYSIPTDTGYARCFFDDSLFLFGELRRVKGILIFDSRYNYYFFWLAEGIGLVRNEYDEFGSYLLLNYAKINGIEYGTLVTSVDEKPLLPAKFMVSQNYPNPFNPSTKISYSIKKDGFVTLKVYDILGVEIATLVSEPKTAGSYEAEFNAAHLPSGMYIYILQSGAFTDVKKMLLTK